MFLLHSKLIHKFPFKLFLQDLLKYAKGVLTNFYALKHSFW